MVILCLYVCGHIILELELDFCSDDCFDVWDDFYMLYIFQFMLLLLLCGIV